MNSFLGRKSGPGPSLSVSSPALFPKWSKHKSLGIKTASVFPAVVFFGTQPDPLRRHFSVTSGVRFFLPWVTSGKPREFQIFQVNDKSPCSGKGLFFCCYSTKHVTLLYENLYGSLQHVSSPHNLQPKRWQAPGSVMINYSISQYTFLPSFYTRVALLSKSFPAHSTFPDLIPFENGALAIFKCAFWWPGSVFHLF